MKQAVLVGPATVEFSEVEKPVAKTEPKPVTKTEPKQTEVKKSESSSVKTQQTASQVQQKQQTSPVQEKVQPQQTVTKREVVYQKSIEELMAENAQKKKSNATWDDSIFGEEGQSSSSQSSSSSVASNKTNQNSVTNTFEGFAGSSSESQTVQTASESRFSENSNNSVSSSTSQALSKISSTKYVAKNPKAICLTHLLSCSSRCCRRLKGGGEECWLLLKWSSSVHHASLVQNRVDGRPCRLPQLRVPEVW